MRGLVLILLVSCTPQPAAEVKDTFTDMHGWQVLSRLFTEIIGRAPAQDEVIENKENKTGANSVDLFGKWYKKELATNDYYDKMVKLLLASQQFVDEGFLHLHRDRLLLAHQGNADFMGNSRIDYYALRQEMAELAQEDNYWKILTYRTKLLSISTDEKYGIYLNPCLTVFGRADPSFGEETRSTTTDDNTEGNATDENRDYCIDFLLASFLPDYSTERLCYEVVFPEKYLDKKFSNVFAKKCGIKNIKGEDKDFCAELNKGYQTFFEKNYAEVAEEDDSHCYPATEIIPDEEGTGEIPTPLNEENVADNELRNKVEENLLELVYFYISSYLSIDADIFVKVEVPAHTDVRELLLEGERGRYEGGGYFLKAIVPPDLQGIYASPYWLTRHRTNAENRGLHRARLILHSWFCEHISPDAASLGGGVVTDEEKEAFKDYFAADDAHVRSDKNCFDCHTRIQPLANYFGRLTHGVPYSDRLLFNGTISGLYHRRLLEKENAHTRPANYYETDRGSFFFKKDGEGMTGLAELLRTYPQVQQCLVRSTWNTIFGSRNKLNSKEVSEAVTEFKTRGFNYRALLSHLLLSEKARTFFVEGQEEFEKMIAEEKEKLTCETAKLDDAGDEHGKTAQHVIDTTCASCHSNGNYQTSEIKFYTNTFVETADAIPLVYNRIVGCAIPTMPQGEGYQMLVGNGYEITAEKQQKLLTCYLEERATTMNAVIDTNCNALAPDPQTAVASDHTGGKQ